MSKRTSKRRAIQTALGQLGWHASGKDVVALLASHGADCREGAGIDTMTWMDWYDGLAKPGWTPSPPTIGLIWQILYDHKTTPED